MLGQGIGARFHHVGIIVPTRKKVEGYLDLFGLTIQRETFVSTYDALCLFTAGVGACIEFIVPSGGVLAEFNHRQGGIHHIALRVDDIYKAMESLAVEHVECLEREPVKAGPLLINFIPPAYTRGTIIEIVQELEELDSLCSQ